jgi:LysW-gamma-L-lysine carboxypeptidase
MLIEDMVKIYSPTGSEEGIVDFLIHWAAKNGFKSHRDDVGNFIAEKGQGREILLVGHVDTVPGEIPVRIKDNQLFGRGSVDAKAPLACFLEAASAIDDARITIVGAVDEEGDSKGAKNILGKYDPEFIIVGEPSGWSNLNIGYKGRLNIYYSDMKSKEHGSTSNRNAVEDAMIFYNWLKKYCEEYNEDKKLFDQLGIKLLSMNSSDDGFKDKAEMVVNFRTPLGFSLRGLKTNIEDLKGDANVQFSPHEDPVKVSKSNKLITSFIRAIRSGGGEVKFKLKTGTSDMNILQKYGVPMVTYGPGDSSLDHTPHEHLDLDEYEKAVGILTNVLKDLSSN